jgi:2-polyprenyl-3-methyl-5-hydroxy-6-metoxy-1,4-benzoquinol methylase
LAASAIPLDRFQDMTTGFQQVSIDDVQAFWNDRPCNVRHSRKVVGSREYFDEVEERKYFVEPHIPAFAQFDNWAGKRVLEIGCGIGTDTINFARAGARVTVIELSDASLALARQRADLFGLTDHIDFHQGNAEELARHIPREEYDLVYSFGVIHHTPHPARVFAEIRNYLGPTGIFKAMVYHRRSWRVAEMILKEGHGRFWDAAAIIARNSEAQSGSPVTYSYTRKEISTLLADHGLTVTDLQVEHIFPYKVSSYIEHRYVKRWPFRALPAETMRLLESRLGWHLCVTAARSDGSN